MPRILKEHNSNDFGFNYDKSEKVVTDEYGNYWDLQPYLDGTAEVYRDYDEAVEDTIHGIDECCDEVELHAPVEEYASALVDFVYSCIGSKFINDGRGLINESASSSRIKESSDLEEDFFDFRDDMIHAIMEVFEKYNAHSEVVFGKSDFDSVINFMDSHGMFDPNYEG